MIRFGVVGTNWITERLLAGAQESKDFELTAVYSRTMEKAKAFAAKYGASNTFTSLEAMAKSDKIDAVYIASPNALHAEQAILFMNHGKHVLCEKPMASNLKEVDSMIAVAKENDVVLMEAMKSTLLPNFKSVQKHLHKIGKVRRYTASFCKYSSRYDAYKEGTILNAFKPELSNGALMDLGVYCLYPMVVLFGNPLEIKASSFKLDSGVDGKGSLLLNYGDMDAVISYSKMTDSHLPTEIQGEHGTILIDKISTPSHVEIRYKDGTVETISQDQPHHSMFYEVEEFIQLIKQSGMKESEMNSWHHSRMTIKIMDEARRQTGIHYPADFN